jgi:very-short-patch-repair endonuclease
MEDNTVAKVKLICAWCGKDFLRERKDVDRYIRIGRNYFFCSQQCTNRYKGDTWRKPDVLKVCPVCGDTFLTRQTRKEATFCSRGCASRGSVTEYRRQKARKMGYINIQNTLKLTQAQKYKKLSHYLKHKNVAHEFEYRVKDFIFDLALFDNRTLIEFDGKEHKYDSERKRLDTIKDTQAQSNGWNVIRIPIESNITIPLHPCSPFT